MDPRVAEVLIPLSAVVLGLAAGMLAFYFRHRRNEMFHRERMAAIEKNIELPESFFQIPELSVRAHLLRGLIWLFIGIGLVVFLVAMSFAEGDKEVLAAAALGLIPGGVGIAYLIVYRLEVKKANLPQ